VPTWGKSGSDEVGLNQEECGRLGGTLQGTVSCKGFLQKQGVDFEEVYAPVSKQTTVRALLAVCAEKDLELEQLDVKTTFLNGHLEEEICMQQAQGYEEGSPTVVCKLRRAIYGLRQDHGHGIFG
jgi:hypothetical protein